MSRITALIVFSQLLALAAFRAPLLAGDSLFGEDAEDVKIVEQAQPETKTLPGAPPGYPNGESIRLGRQEIASGHWVRDLEDVQGGRIVVLEVPDEGLSPQARLRLDRSIRLIMQTLALDPDHYLVKNGRSVASGTVRTLTFDKEYDEEKGVIRYKGGYVTDVRSDETAATPAKAAPPIEKKVEAKKDDDGETPSWKAKGYPNGEPVVRGGRTVVLRHFVRDLEKYPDHARIVYMAVPYDPKESAQQRLMRERQMQLWMRTLAVNPCMFVAQGSNSAQGTVRTVEFKKEIDEEKGEIVYKGAYWVE